MKKCICGHEMTETEWKNQWACHRCERTKPIYENTTSVERLRNMTIEEIAERIVMQNEMQ